MSFQYLTPFAFLTLISFGCQQKRNVIVADKKFTIPPMLIQQSIDSTRVLDSVINTKTFYVDVELLKQIDRNTVTLFLNERRNLKVTNFDSLVKVKSPWLKNEFFRNDIIRFEKVELFGGDTILVETTKRRAIDASFGTEIIFKKTIKGVVCIKSNITWIN